MFPRSLFVILACSAAWNAGTVAIARSHLTLDSGYLLAQAPPSEIPQTSEDRAEQQRRGIQGLQSRLAQLGYYTGTIDGVYGSGTQQAVAAFQQAAGLTATGMPDAVTQERLLSPDAPTSTAAPDSEAAAPASGAEIDPFTADVPEAAPGNEETAGLGLSQAAPAAATETTETTDPDTEAEQPESRNRWLRLALIGLVIAVLVGVGGGVLLLLTRRSTPDPDLLGDDAPPANGALPDQAAMPVMQTKVAARNGSQSGEIPLQSGAVDVASQAMTEGSGAPRLTKINIIDELIEDLDSLDPGVRRKAIWELGQRGNSAAVRPLVRLLADIDSHEQSLVLAALSEIAMQTLKPVNRALAISLQDENPDVRKNAIRDLTRVYDMMGQAGKLLGHAASDDDPDVRRTASWALDQLNHMRLSATEPAGLLKEAKPSVEPPESLPDSEVMARPD